MNGMYQESNEFRPIPNAGFEAILDCDNKIHSPLLLANSLRRMPLAQSAGFVAGTMEA